VLAGFFGETYAVLGKEPDKCRCECVKGREEKKKQVIKQEARLLCVMRTRTIDWRMNMMGEETWHNELSKIN
jgi:hypothetical protein